MKKISCLGVLIVSFFCFSSNGLFAADKVLTMSTTTSTQTSGLLDYLLPVFEKKTGIFVKVIAKGTGAAIRDGIDGNVDLIFVHAKEREEKFVADGYGTKRFPVMHNDFVIVGPVSDPAAIKGIKNSAEAFGKIARNKATFISRGDDSGTHTKEQAIWQNSSVLLAKNSVEISKKGKSATISYDYPADSQAWYLSIGQGMGKTLSFADEKKAYALADRGTYIKYKFGSDQGIDLEVLCEGEPLLENPYGVIPVNPLKHAHVKYDYAQTFADWITSKEGQELIENYKLLGKQLFYADAI